MVYSSSLILLFICLTSCTNLDNSSFCCSEYPINNVELFVGWDVQKRGDVYYFVNDSSKFKYYSNDQVIEMKRVQGGFLGNDTLDSFPLLDSLNDVFQEMKLKSLNTRNEENIIGVVFFDETVGYYVSDSLRRGSMKENEFKDYEYCIDSRFFLKGCE